MRDGGTAGSTLARGSAASTSGAWLAVAAILAVAAAGCGQVNDLKAKKAMKNANQAYAAQDYKKASELYEEAIQAAPDSQEGHEAYFYLGNCYDNLWKPSRKGEADNDALLTKAVDNYQKASDSLSQSSDERDKKLGKLSLQYLVAAYGLDKLNDPAKQEPIVQKMIQLEPSDVTNYFALAKIYEDAGAYDNAEQMLLKAKDIKPNDPDVYAQLAGYYNRQGEFEKTIDALQQGADKDPKNPTAHFVIATYYWDDARRTSASRRRRRRITFRRGSWL
jgi:tetratricopeptide (TPR) repeat protein